MKMFLLLAFQFLTFIIRFDEIIFKVKRRNICLKCQTAFLISLGEKKSLQFKLKITFQQFILVPFLTTVSVPTNAPKPWALITQSLPT